uniref:Uncharacterized protein n=2 Tax=Physcomitrium patens TaxID=3218 RepID=A0A2K1JTC3_PHYPA|nr:hypothetical protein PHYPA_014506 [Physcomitrium patens]
MKLRWVDLHMHSGSLNAASSRAACADHTRGEYRSTDGGGCAIPIWDRSALPTSDPETLKPPSCNPKTHPVEE